MAPRLPRCDFVCQTSSIEMLIKRLAKFDKIIILPLMNKIMILSLMN